jgi:ankyrin repeat protein
MAHFEMILMLFGAGANPTIKDNDGHNAFDMAKEYGNIPEVIKLLEQFSKIMGEYN